MSERGQSIILLAGAMVMLLVFVGLAIDAGVIYIGNIHLSRAVDAAVLAGVVELPDADATESVCYSKPFETRTCNADDKAQDFLWANGITSTAAITGTEFFQSIRESGVIGSYRYRITATHQVDLYFLPLVNFNYVKMRGTATADYNPWVDIYTDQSGALGVLSTVNQAFKGYNEGTDRGDAFSPSCSTTCGPGDSGRNPWYPELQGKYIYRIYVPSGYSEDIVRVEILDPEDWDDEPFLPRVMATFYDSARGGIVTEEILCDGPTCRTGSTEQPTWFLGLDEGTSNNPLRFTLFYYEKLCDGTIIRSNFAEYIGSNPATDMQWLSPPGFEVEVDDWCNSRQCPRIDNLEEKYCQSDGSFYIYLEVESQGRHRENAFDLWAGPAYDDVPSEVNARNCYIIPRGRQGHGSAGVIVYAVGHMAYNSNARNRVEMQLTDIPAAWAGHRIRIDYFDIDTDTQPPLVFYFDTIPQKDWSVCYDDAGFCDTPVGREHCVSTADGTCADTCKYGYTCADFGFVRVDRSYLVNHLLEAPTVGCPDHKMCDGEPSDGHWRTYEFTLPSREIFYGGRLKVSYGGGNMDNVTLRMMVESAPRLVK